LTHHHHCHLYPFPYQYIDVVLKILECSIFKESCILENGGMSLEKFFNHEVLFKNPICLTIVFCLYDNTKAAAYGSVLAYSLFHHDGRYLINLMHI
jgi:hypothetical protein